MDTQYSNPRNLAYILTDSSISRDNAIFEADNGIIESGTVLAIADGKYAPAAAADTAVAICAYRVDTTGADVDGVITARLSEVKNDMLIYAADVDDDTKKAAKQAELATNNIITR